MLQQAIVIVVLNCVHIVAFLYYEASEGDNSEEMIHIVKFGRRNGQSCCRKIRSVCLGLSAERTWFLILIAVSGKIAPTCLSLR